MGAIGAVTSVRMPPVQPAAATLPVQGTTTLRAPGEPSGVHGIAYTGDVLADRVIGTFAVDPFRYGSLDGAIGVVSGSFNFNPAPSAVQPSVAGTAVAIDPGNALLNLPPSAAAALSPAEFIARSQSSIAKVYRGFVTSQGAGQSVQRGVAGMVVELDHALRRDEQGLTSFDHQVMAIEQQRAEQVRKLKERLGDPKDVVAKLMSLTIAQGMVQREREKLEELRNLLISLLIGVQVPKGTVERLGALGMGPLVEQLVQMMVGGGQGPVEGHAGVAALADRRARAEHLDPAGGRHRGGHARGAARAGAAGDGRDRRAPGRQPRQDGRSACRARRPGRAAATPRRGYRRG